MAGPVQIGIELTGENQSAVRAVRQVGEEVDRTNTKVEASSGRFAQWGQALSSRMGSIGDTLGGAATSLASGDIEGALGGLLGGGNIAAVIVTALAQTLPNIIMGITNVAGRLNEAQMRARQPLSGADLGQSMGQIAQLSAEQEGWVPFSRGAIRQLGDYLTGKQGWNPLTLIPGAKGSYDVERKMKEQFINLIQSNPNEAMAVLQSGQFGSMQADMQQVFNEWAGRAVQSPYFTQGMSQMGNVYFNITAGIGDPRAIGSDVHSSLDSYFRINPQMMLPYTAPYTGR
jgi:hypothetical protein